MSPMGGIGQKSPIGQIGQMSPIGQIGQMSPMGQIGQMSPMGQIGQMSPMGLIGQIGQMSLMGLIGLISQMSPMGLIGHWYVDLGFFEETKTIRWPAKLIHPSAPQMAMMMISRNVCRLVRSTRGSATAAKQVSKSNTSFCS